MKIRLKKYSLLKKELEKTGYAINYLNKLKIMSISEKEVSVYNRYGNLYCVSSDEINKCSENKFISGVSIPGWMIDNSIKGMELE